jgi:hypothetical protein
MLENPPIYRYASLALAFLFSWSTLTSSATAATRRPEGVSAEIEESVQKGIDFLIRTQAANGSWSSDGTWGRYPTAMTALAGMCLLASGSTSTRGPHAPAVRKAADFLLRVAQPNGLIATPAEAGRSMHGHGFAMLFLAEVYGNEEDERRQHWIHDVLTRSVRITERSQSRAGGWLYSPDQDADEGSVTVTQMQGLRACRNAGIFVNPTTIQRAIKYIEQSANPDGGIRYSLMSSFGSRPAITAAAVATLYNAGEYDSPLALKCLSYCDRTISIGHTRGHYYYAHLYLAQAKFQRGGRDWTRYYRAIAEQLTTAQNSDGSWAGDWVGTTYGTAIAVTILQLPYSFVSIYQR